MDGCSWDDELQRSLLIMNHSEKEFGFEKIRKEMT